MVFNKFLRYGILVASLVFKCRDDAPYNVDAATNGNSRIIGEYEILDECKD